MADRGRQNGGGGRGGGEVVVVDVIGRWLPGTRREVRCVAGVGVVARTRVGPVRLSGRTDSTPEQWGSGRMLINKFLPRTCNK